MGSAERAPKKPPAQTPPPKQKKLGGETKKNMPVDRKSGGARLIDHKGGKGEMGGPKRGLQDGEMVSPRPMNTPTCGTEHPTLPKKNMREKMKDRKWTIFSLILGPGFMANSPPESEKKNLHTNKKNPSHFHPNSGGNAPKKNSVQVMGGAPNFPINNREKQNGGGTGGKKKPLGPRLGSGGCLGKLLQSGGNFGWQTTKSHQLGPKLGEGSYCFMEQKCFKSQ